MADSSQVNTNQEVGYPCFCYGCLKRLYMYTVVNDNKYCNECRLKLDGYVPD